MEVIEMRESSIQQRVRLDAAQLGVELWRNNSGVLKNENGVPVRYGLANDSKQLNAVIKSSDLIGVTPWDGRFLAVECKPEGWKFNQLDEREVAQKAFHDIVIRAGGRAGFVTSIEDFRKIISR